MSNSEDNQKRLEEIAEESLDTFAEVAESAKSKIAEALSSGGSGVIANPHSWDSHRAIANIQQINREVTEGYRILSREPAIARVAVTDEDGNRTTYYICRTAPPITDSAGIKLVSYRSTKGRLAALPVGEERTVTLPGGKTIYVEILENAKFHPVSENGEWDSRNSILEGCDYGPLTVESLRALLKTSAEATDILESLLEADAQDDNVRQGLRRSVIQSMDLRDQPILDQYQDEIFRLPLNSRLLILGAPGTGKTTTLIKRLGQKRNLLFLDEDERQVIQNNTFGGADDHARSWIMFTPTELLKLYVKEAFNREGVPAPDACIKTWTEFRNDLARNAFGILRSAAGRGSFVMKDTAQTLTAGTETDQISWFSDFDQWQKSDFWKEMRASAQGLSENPAQEIAEIGSRILKIWDKAGPKLPTDAFASLAGMASEIQELVKGMKESTDGKIREVLKIQLKRDEQFIADMARFIEELTGTSDEPEDPDADDEEEESNQSSGGRTTQTVQHYERAVRAHARARARGRRVAPASRTGRLLEWIGDRSLADAIEEAAKDADGRLIEWIGDRSLNEQELLEVGKSLVVQSALRRFANPVRRYINGIRGRYRKFRRVRQTEKRWYSGNGFRPADIHPLEADIVLLTVMRATDALITGARSLRSEGNPARAALERLQGLYRTQVLVDEATDFSPVQLACMAALARPGTRSFFACGDFNQRITNWGVRSDRDMQWAVPDMDTKRIEIAYRQSRQLHDLARRIADLSGDGAADTVLPEGYADNDGVPPVLVKNMAEVPAIADWLTGRIVEIEKFVDKLPSTAVLVNDEDEVSDITAALRDPLADQNIQVTACANGEVRGNDGSVRVVNVQHIKGLEFEAVFFVGIDKLAKRHPDLFDKFLYVGATRAAVYLGMTCEGGLSAAMTGLDELFAEGWR